MHTIITGDVVMIVHKYGAKPEPAGLPIALRSTATEFGKVRIEKGSAMQNAKIRRNSNYRHVCLGDLLYFRNFAEFRPYSWLNVRFLEPLQL